MKKILITGGAGYIASHTNIELLKEDYEIVLIDNFTNSCPESIKRVEELSYKKIQFYEVDLMDLQALEKVFIQEPNIDSVIHFAALKSVGDSVNIPLDYYENNITGSLNLYRAMKKYGVRNIVFSSSATVYGNPEQSSVKEDASTSCTNPYGRTKLMMEEILLDCAKAYNWNIVILRYFNPVGAHESGRIGEDPKYPANLLPYVSQVAAGIREKVMVFGQDWDTHDGTGVRDYIHVVDLAKAHVKAIEKINTDSGTFIYNIGTGRGYSVLEMISAFGRACGHKVPYGIAPRREGDIGEVTADPSKSANELGWTAEYSLQDMVSSAWKWQSMNPNGYKNQTI